MGLDVGTTGVKAAVFDETGKIRGYGFEEYDIIKGGDGIAEQDAEAVWRACKRVIAKAAGEVEDEVKAICASVQGDAVIPISNSREALAPAQLGMDYRGKEETEYCESLFGSRELFNLTGIRPHPLNSIVKILRYKRKQPEFYEKSWKFVTYSDFIMGKLGSDEMVIDRAMASRTMAYDREKQDWSDEILQKLSIDRWKLSDIVKPGEIVGKIPPKLAGELNLGNNVSIVAGGHDQTCAAFGAGLVKKDLALDSHGTAEVISAAFTEPLSNDVMYASYYPCYNHVVEGMFFTFALNHTGGISLKWFMDTFFNREIDEALALGINPYDMVMNKAEASKASLIFLPHFNGSGTPTCRLEEKGVIVGLTLATSKGDIARAIVESLAYEMRLNIETMKTAGVSISSLRCVGGGARSPFGIQLKADITGLPISTLKVREAACLGAGLLAAMATGSFSNALQASEAVFVEETIFPMEAKERYYNEMYEKYLKVYQSIGNIVI